MIILCSMFDTKYPLILIQADRHFFQYKNEKIVNEFKYKYICKILYIYYIYIHGNLTPIAD